MNTKKIFSGIFLIILSVSGLSAQSLTPFQNVKIIHDTDTLHNPFAGGMNLPQFSVGDFDFDGIQDLFTFDKDGSKPSVYLCTDFNNLIYTYSPQHSSVFPAGLKHWVLLRDFNCDGYPDIFTTGSYFNSVYVYLNTPSGGTYNFSSPPVGPLTADNDTILIFDTDIPAIVDVDNDNDLDILGFDNQGFFMVFFENKSQDLFQDCNHPEFTVNTTCWGQFREEGLNNDVYLNISCKSDKGYDDKPTGTRHAGSTVTAFDVDSDGAKELFIGDISFDNLAFLHNGGDSIFADMDQFIYEYPDYDQPVNLTTFPAAYMIDVNIDALQDLVVTPNSPSVGSNFLNILYYKNVGTPQNAVFEFQQRDFIQNTMIDCGSASRPVFYDYNQDGLMDILIGNDRYKTSSSSEDADLTLYKNTGTPTEPMYELVTRTYLDLKNLFDNPRITSVHPAFGDLDGDGDKDLLLGDYEGKVHFFINNVTGGGPAQFDLTLPNYNNIDVGAMAMPFMADLDYDGDLDLIIGEQMGNLNYYENKGTPSQPTFSSNPDNATFGNIDVNPICCTGYAAPFFYRNQNNEWELLIGMEKGNVWQYDGISGNLSGSFNKITETYGNLSEAGRCAVSGADINNDGQLELVVGNIRGGIGLYHTALPAVSIEPEILANFRIYPNPLTEGTLCIQSDNPVSQLIIMDLQGKTMGVFSVKDDCVQTGKLPQGLYFYQIFTENRKIFTGKLMIK